jgi:hypothetical protein
MRTRGIVAWVIILAATVAPAAEKDELPGLDAASLAERATQRLIDPLELSAEQATRVQAVLTGDYQRRMEIYTTYKGRVDQETADQLYQKLQASQQQSLGELEPVLSAEQLEQFEAVLLQQRTQAVGELSVYRLQDRLGLSPEQRDLMVPIFADYVAEQARILREAREAGGGMRNMRAVRGQTQRLRAELDRKLAPILSEEQMQLYLVYRKEHQDQMRQRLRAKGVPAR